MATQGRPQVHRSDRLADFPELLTVKEAATVLRISPQTLYRHLLAGKIPGAFRIGSDWRINLAMLINGAANGYQK